MLCIDLLDHPDDSCMAQENRGTQLCVLAIPADMGMADFCKFVGAFLPSVRTMRLVRRDGGQSVCLIILQLADQEIADEFYLEYNGRAVQITYHIQPGKSSRCEAGSCAFLASPDASPCPTVFQPGARDPVPPCVCQRRAVHNRSSSCSFAWTR